MSEDKKSLINLIPDSVDNAVKNITDKPTQNMGTTLADIWYLVFGGISQAAEKRKLKYSYALQEFENELKEKINKIPNDKLVSGDIQIIAQALDAAKYCIEKEELRKMFSNLICNSLSSDANDKVHPIFANIIRSLSPYDVHILLKLNENIIDFSENHDKQYSAFSTLSQLGLIYFDESCDFNTDMESPDENTIIMHLNRDKHQYSSMRIKGISITKLGADFISVCT